MANAKSLKNEGKLIFRNFHTSGVILIRFNNFQKFSSFIGELCPVLEVTGANHPQWMINGCYTQDENILAYNGPADMRIIFFPEDGEGPSESHWYIGNLYEDVWRFYYGRTSTFDGPQGEYVSFNDDSIATVNCKSECINDKKLSNAKSMKKKGKLQIKIPLN